MLLRGESVSGILCLHDIPLLAHCELHIPQLSFRNANENG